ncbi:lysophospholipid acyltransferase family protein [Nocardia sp. NPDC051030]|uniref:lysophospholipid acyltransferase family protein n=1 Tax=Nocardia sp. NPDC051030 TaxID=3155162 RepID=UPI0034184BDC
MMPAFLSPGGDALSCPPAAPTAHPWMPNSPCGPDCVETPPEAGTLRVVARLFGVGAVLATFPFARLATPRRHRPTLHARYARSFLYCLGISVRVVDNRDGQATPTGGRNIDSGGSQQYSGQSNVVAARRGTSADPAGTSVDPVAMSADAAPAGGVLVVAGHIGWTDVIALSAVEPLAFVARADLVDWPLLGSVARKVRVIPIERERLRELPGVVREVATRLTAGERVGIFPEGTTWCGRAYGRLRPALFQAAIDSGAPVQPVRLRYLSSEGELSTVPGFVGIDTMADSIRRVLRSRGVVAEVMLQPLLEPGDDRRELARRCEQSIRGDSLDQAFAGVIHRLEQEVQARNTGVLPEQRESAATPAPSRPQSPAYAN